MIEKPSFFPKAPEFDVYQQNYIYLSCSMAVSQLPVFKEPPSKLQDHWIYYLSVNAGAILEPTHLAYM